MVNNEQELQKAFMAFLIEDAATQGMQIQSEEDLKQYVESLGQEGIQAKYQEFMKLMSGASTQKPSKRLGGHLNYLKQIKGACPDGEETYYFKEGGSVKRGCKPCMEKAKKGAKFDNEDTDPVKKFKCGRKVKKAEPGAKFTQKTKTDKYGNTTYTRTYPGHKPVSYTVSEDGEGQGYYSDHKGRSRVEDQDSLGRVYHNGPYKFQKKKELTKHQNGKTINKKDQEVTNFVIDLLKNPNDPYVKNKRINDMYRQFAEENEVTGIKSFLDEIKWRWYATPGLGGKPEEPNPWNIANNYHPFNTDKITKILENIFLKSKDIKENK